MRFAMKRSASGGIALYAPTRCTTSAGPSNRRGGGSGNGWSTQGGWLTASDRPPRR